MRSALAWGRWAPTLPHPGRVGHLRPELDQGVRSSSGLAPGTPRKPGVGPTASRSFRGLQRPHEDSGVPGWRLLGLLSTPGEAS